MFLIIGVIFIGIILILLEILMLPGMIAGIVGGMLIFFGVFQAYSQFGSTTGHITLASSVVVTAIAIYSSFKTGAWNRFGLKNTINSKVNDVSSLDIKEGDEARTISALRPSGTILYNDKRIEANTNGEMIEAGTKVVVTKVLPNKVVVKIKVTEL